MDGHIDRSMFEISYFDLKLKSSVFSVFTEVLSVRFCATGVSRLNAEGCFKLVLFSSTMLWED